VARKATDTVQLKLRFSKALRLRLEREAKKQNHSLNAEIIRRLEQSFRKEEEADLTVKATEKVEDRLKAALEEAVKRMERSGFKIARVQKRPNRTDEG
jgi:Arc-like DNA binding domain